MDRDEYLRHRTQYITGGDHAILRFDLLVGFAALIGFVVSVVMHDMINVGAPRALALSFVSIVVSELASAEAFRTALSDLDRMYDDGTRPTTESRWSRLTTYLNWLAVGALIVGFALMIMDQG